jgi:hypothetical protein
MNLTENIFKDQTVSITVSLDYMFEKVMEVLLYENLPKKEETANTMIAVFKEQGRLDMLWSLIHNNSPSVPKFQIGDFVKPVNKNDRVKTYHGGDYIYGEGEYKVVDINIVNGQLRVEWEHEGKMFQNSINSSKVKMFTNQEQEEEE